MADRYGFPGYSFLTGGFSLGKEKAIVTGAALGMGRGISTVLAEEGYDIAFSYYPGTQNVEAGIETTVAMLQERGARAWHFPADLTKPGAAEPSHTSLLPLGEPLQLSARSYEELHLHLLELAHAPWWKRTRSRFRLRRT